MLELVETKNWAKRRGSGLVIHTLSNSAKQPAGPECSLNSVVRWLILQSVYQTPGKTETSQPTNYQSYRWLLESATCCMSNGNYWKYYLLLQQVIICKYNIQNFVYCLQEEEEEKWSHPTWQTAVLLLREKMPANCAHTCVCCWHVSTLVSVFTLSITRP